MVWCATNGEDRAWETLISLEERGVEPIDEKKEIRRDAIHSTLEEFLLPHILEIISDYDDFTESSAHLEIRFVRIHTNNKLKLRSRNLKLIFGCLEKILKNFRTFQILQFLAFLWSLLN